MFRHHRILYRRLLRGQSSDELIALRGESTLFPTLLSLIDDELQRRTDSTLETAMPSFRREAGSLRPFIVSHPTIAHS